MKNKLLSVFITLIFIIIFTIFYKGLQDTNIYTPQKKINKETPLFYAELFNSGKKVYSKELFGSDKFYLLNIWSSWCVPCRQEHPLLMSLAKNKKVEIIGINYKDKKINAKSFFLTSGDFFFVNLKFLKEIFDVNINFS